MNIAIVCGARPNFMKVAPIIRAIRNNKSYETINSRLIYTGMQNDPTLEDSLFNDLEIDRPDFYLDVDCENLNELTGQVMSKFERYLQKYPTDVVIVVDDLASTMAIAIVTKKQGIKLAHIAAGTRSFDIAMPKEINRLVIDGLSDILFTAGISNNNIANKEGAELSKVYMVGNILIDNLRYYHNRLQRPKLLDRVGLKEKGYLVFTLNRKALIGDKPHLSLLIKAMINGMKGTAMPILAPLRSEAAMVVKEILAEISSPSFFILIEPQSYLDFAYITANAYGLITDSGNVAEEATFNQVPCITVNSYTEHIETVKQGTNVLVGEDPELLSSSVSDMMSGQWKKATLPDRWDGRSAERILQILC